LEKREKAKIKVKIISNIKSKNLVILKNFLKKNQAKKRLIKKK